LGQRHGAALRDRLRVRRGARGLHADDPDVRPEPRVQRRRHTREQAAAAGRHDHGADVGHLLGDLQAERGLAGDDVDVVERVDDGAAGALGLGPGLDERLVDGPAVRAHGRAVALGRGHLGQRGALGHVDDGVDAERARRERHPLRVVARTGGDDAAPLLLGAQARHPQVRAADLERAAALQVLALEHDAGAGEPAERTGLLDRGARRDAVERRGRDLDLLERRVRHHRAVSSSNSSRTGSGTGSLPLRYLIAVLATAMIGTASSAPTMPPASVPVATASSTATGCSLSARLISSGCSRWPSTCCTASTISSMTTARTSPPSTSATATATAPLIRAPMIGMNAPTNTRIPSGMASGTPSSHAPRPMPMPSTKATRIWVRA